MQLIVFILRLATLICPIYKPLEYKLLELSSTDLKQPYRSPGSGFTTSASAAAVFAAVRSAVNSGADILRLRPVPVALFLASANDGAVVPVAIVGEAIVLACSALASGDSTSTGIRI